MTKTQYQKIREHVIDQQHASMSSIMLKFKINYDLALEMLDQLETEGVISAEYPDGQRTVLIGGDDD